MKESFVQEPMRVWLTITTGDISVSNAIEWQVRGVRYSLFFTSSFPFLISIIVLSSLKQTTRRRFQSH